jgi:eukaryotic-like serine/threonine-protein kinase
MTDRNDAPKAVPERNRVRQDMTVAIPPPVSEETPRITPSTRPVALILEDVREPVGGRLEVEAKIASGGMGTIEVALDRALDRRVAVKTLHRHLRGDAAAVRMFLREARLTGLLDHPHVVPVYELGERPDGNLFFAMKLVEGRTLAAWIDSLPAGLLDTATLYMLLDVISKVCDALAFAHSRGVLHCDVKPANVMVGDFGQVYLMDWGIARLIANEAPSPSTDTSVIGTPCYMSPEQARGDRKRLDERSDVFLIGAMLYEVLTHRAPYVNGDRLETLALAAAGAFPSPRKLAGAAVPIELDRIVMRAMAKAPSDRYPSVSALKEDLVRFMRGGAEFPRRQVAAGEVIVAEGDPGDAAYIVVDGACEVRKETPGGALPLQQLGPGDVFGEMAILTDGPRTASVVALAPTTLLVVTGQVLEQEMAALKPWMATLLKSLAVRFRDVDMQQRATFANAPSPARIANQILMQLTTWGDHDEHGGASAPWSTVAEAVEAQLGAPPVSIFGAISRFGLVLDLDADRLHIPSLADLREQLRSLL